MPSHVAPEATTRRTFMIAAAASLSAGPALPQGVYPNRPIRIVVPFPAGGGTDAVARPLAEGLAKRLGQTVIIDNKSGVGGNLGTDSVAKAAPDGYTLLLTPSAPIVQSVALYRKLPYNPQTDLTMVADLVLGRLVFVVGGGVQANSFKELLALAKANPGKLTMGSWGAGSHPHLLQANMDKGFGTQITHVPYRGEGLMLTDLIGGQISMATASLTAIKPHLASGRLRALAVVGNARAAELPDVPSFVEQGYKGTVFDVIAPVSILVPAKTPVDIIERLNKEVVAVMKGPDMVRRVQDLGLEVAANTPAEASAGYQQRLPIMLKMVRDLGVTLD